jgi:hypothetical protein
MTVADVAAAAGRNQVPLGIAYMVGSTVMLAGGNAVVKWQLASYPQISLATVVAVPRLLCPNYEAFSIRGHTYSLGCQ